MKNVRTAIDLFCGAGGLSAGFQQAGYCILAGNDFFEAAGQTFLATHPDAIFFPDLIQNIQTDDLLQRTGLRKGDLDCLIGGPPCQAFSVYNHQRGLHDERAGLFQEYLRMVDGLKPAWIVMENVTGIFSAGGGAIVERIYAGLHKLGYNVEHRVLKTEEFGVPQKRRRVVFIGNRIGAPICWPEPMYGSGKKPYRTIYDAISDLPVLKNGENKGNKCAYASPAKSEYQKMLRRGSSHVRNHIAPRLGAINLERMQHIPPGGSWRDVPFDLLPNGMKKAKRSDHTKRYGRMQWDGLSSTILTKCDMHWGAFIHPDQNRSITVREAARIQSFPDCFTFKGSRTEQYIQVGNAVPPLLGRCIAEAVIESENLMNEVPFQAVAS